jgi:glycosyl transferase family 87
MTGRRLGILGLVGAIGWIGLILLTAQLRATDPPTAGFDLDLLIGAGRNVAAGQSPYDPAILGGVSPVAERLFYSYPPVVAQAMAVISALPSTLILVVWDALAVAGLSFVGVRLARVYAPELEPRTVALVVAALIPFVFPFAIGLVFGNLDVFFPLLYGLLLLAMHPGATRGDGVTGGVATSVAGLAKLHPGSLGLWVVVAAVQSVQARRVLVWAVVAAAAILGASLVVGGTQPWLDYANVVKAGSGADLVDPRNGGPAAQLALLLGGSTASAESVARSAQVAVTTLALAVTAVAAWRVKDPVSSLAWAAAASLVILPVTWYHYPSALIPFAMAALLRARGTSTERATLTAVAAAGAVAALAIAWLPLLYVAVALVLVAAHVSVAREGREVVAASPA